MSFADQLRNNYVSKDDKREKEIFGVSDLIISCVKAACETASKNTNHCEGYCWSYYDGFGFNDKSGTIWMYSETYSGTANMSCTREVANEAIKRAESEMRKMGFKHFVIEKRDQSVVIQKGLISNKKAPGFQVFVKVEW